MFSYDGNVLADTVWAEYLEIKKENLHLKAQLNVAAKTVEALKEKLVPAESAAVETASTEVSAPTAAAKRSSK